MLYRYRQGQFAIKRTRPTQDPVANTLSADDTRHPLTGSLRLIRRLQRFDVLANMKLIDRLYIGASSAPVQSRYLADYDLEVGDGGRSRRLPGRLLVECIEINPR